MKETHIWRQLICHSRALQSITLSAFTRRVHSTASAMTHDNSSSPSTSPAPASSSLPASLPLLEHVRAEKAHLRQRLKARLAALTASQLNNESYHATQLLLSHPSLSPLLAASPGVAVYLSMPAAEFQTRPLLSHLFAAGKRVFLPRVVSSERMLLLECHSLADIDALPANCWGIREPPITDGRRDAMQCVEQVGLCVVPGVAFTRDGLRLGHGRGYYDRYLHAWDEERQRRGLVGGVPTVALALQCQLVEQLPVLEHDRRIDHVIHAPTHDEADR